MATEKNIDQEKSVYVIATSDRRGEDHHVEVYRDHEIAISRFYDLKKEMNDKGKGSRISYHSRAIRDEVPAKEVEEEPDWGAWHKKKRKQKAARNRDVYQEIT